MRGKVKLAFVLVLSLLPCSLADSPQESNASEIIGQDALILLDSLAAEQKKTLSKFETYDVNLTMTIERPASTEDNWSQRTKHIQQGKKKLRAETSGTTTNAGGGGGVLERHDVVVANDDYVAACISGIAPAGRIGAAYVWEHESYDQMSKKAKNQITSITDDYDFTKTGFGDGFRPLSDMSRWAREENFRLVIVQSGSSSKPSKFRVIAYDDTLAAKPFYECSIDPAHALIVTECVFYNTNANWEPYSILKVEPKEVQSGLWFPATWQLRTFADDNPGQLRSIVRMSVDSITPNVDLVDEECTLSSLHVPADIVILRTDSHGRVNQMTESNGQLVPRKLLGGKQADKRQLP